MSKAEEISSVIRKELTGSVSGLKGTRVGIALSGGVDSSSVLAAMLTVGINPRVISYTPDNRESTDFYMASEVARAYGLNFYPAVVSMGGSSLERHARKTIQMGYSGKVEVECLAPVWEIMMTARKANVEFMFTGDQADGFFILSKWASHNADRSKGIPRGLRTNVQRDDNPERIDYLRKRYWDLDKSCSGAVKQIGLRNKISVLVPYRNEKIFRAFQGSLWSEINRPRLKEPIRLAFAEEFRTIPTRSSPVNIHKGDSEFAVTMGRVLLERFPGPWSTTTGLYRAMARGEV